jgi:ACS family allantoate permease-like MFS transporter
MLVGLPAGALQIITIWAAALGMRYTRNLRCLWGFMLLLVPLVGSILLMVLPASERWGIVVSTWLAACSSSLMVVSLSLAASNVKGNTKKSAVTAIFFVAYCTGCIIGPQLWQAEDAPRYTRGCISSIVSWCLLALTFAAYYAMMKRENLQREKLVTGGPSTITSAGSDPAKESQLAVALNSDMTDRKDLRFRYTL